MPTMPLYEIDAQLCILDDMLEASGGELTPDIERLFNDLYAAKKEKVLGIGMLIHNMLSDLDRIDDEIERLKLRRSRLEAKADSLKSYLLAHVDQGEKFSNHAITISTRRSEAVEVDENLLPKLYMREKITYSPDKEALKQDLKQGADIPGAKLVQRRHLNLV